MVSIMERDESFDSDESLDEPAMDEIIEMMDNADIQDLELDFSEDFQGEHEGGKIYESIEAELPEEEEPEPDDDYEGLIEFEAELPESFYAGLTNT